MAARRARSGQLITLDGFAFQVVGVAAPGFFGVDVGQHFDVAVPICTEADLQRKELDARSSLGVVASCDGKA